MTCLDWKSETRRRSSARFQKGTGIRQSGKGGVKKALWNIDRCDLTRAPFLFSPFCKASLGSHDGFDEDDIDIGMAQQPPLCVDLDGTLLKTDTLHESLLLSFKASPLIIFRFPAWLRCGKAHFKEELTKNVLPDTESLP
jgi:hypothetical protein